MRIQCKNCGKEYRVDEKRLTPEGVRVKCRTCGTILMIRLKQGGKPFLDTGEETMPAPREEKMHPVEAVESAPSPLPEEPKPSSPAYRFCIDCGKPLASRVPPGQVPICRSCKGAGHGREPARSRKTRHKSSRSSPWKKVLFFLLIVVVLALAAFLGYRFAKGQALTFNVWNRHGSGSSSALTSFGYEKDEISAENVRCHGRVPVPSISGAS